LIASVAFFVKIVLGVSQPAKAATRSRAFSNSSVASRASE
jgi:hypothetical protein